MGSQGKSRRVKRVEGNQNVSREINMFQGTYVGCRVVLHNREIEIIGNRMNNNRI
jgi:hypothetical protein